MFKDNSRSTRCCSGVFIIDFEYIWHQILYCLNLNLSMDLRVGSRSPVTFKMMLYVITVNNSFQPLPIFCHKELRLRCCMHRTWIEFCNMIHKDCERYWWSSPSLSATLAKYEKLTLLDALKIDFRRFSH